MDSEIIIRLTRIEEKLTAALKVQDDHEARLRSGEKRQWLHTGALVVLAPLLAKFGVHLPV